MFLIQMQLISLSYLVQRKECIDHFSKVISKIQMANVKVTFQIVFQTANYRSNSKQSTKEI